jgi:hypothetical protein
MESACTVFARNRGFSEDEKAKRCKFGFPVAPPETRLVGEAVCRPSFDEETACLAACTAGTCDPARATCSGGPLDVDCDADCANGPAGASVHCEGACAGECAGTCTGSSECRGFCDGVCASSAVGPGLLKDGSCSGECRGRCLAAPDETVKCAGVCDGTCFGTCRAGPEGTARCDGACSGSSKPVSCHGSVALPPCSFDALCATACRVRAHARAACSVPSVVTLSGVPATLEDEVRVVIETNLRIGARVARRSSRAPRPFRA